VPAAAFEDPDGDALAWSASLAGGVPLPGWLRFDAATRTFSALPGNDRVGALQIRITAADFDGARGSQLVPLTVANVNDAPTLDEPIADQRALAGRAFLLPIGETTFRDVDTGDRLSYAATLADGSPLPLWLAFDAAARTFAGTPALADLGEARVRVVATDTSGASAAADFALVVAEANHAPTLEVPLPDRAFAGLWPMVLALPAGAFADVDAGDRLVVTASLADGTPLPQWLRFDPRTLVFVGEGAGLVDGRFELRVTATDAEGASVSDAFVLTVNAAPNMIAGTDTGAEHIVDAGEHGSAISALGGDDTIAGGAGDDTIDGGEGLDTAVSGGPAANYTLAFADGRLVLADETGADGTDALTGVERLRFTDKTVIVETADPQQPWNGLPEGLYHFFIVAFDAAPGVTYLDQLAEAWWYFEPIYHEQALRTIVNIFTTKPEFTDVYPTTLSHEALAIELVDRIVGQSASEAAKAEAVTDIRGALDIGWTRGDVIYTVFGNLASKPFDDPTWGGTAQQFDRQIDVARVYSEALLQSTTHLQTLRDVLEPVTPATDAGSEAAILELIGQSLLDGDGV
jgi:hypothetical protein